MILSPLDDAPHEAGRLVARTRLLGSSTHGGAPAKLEALLAAKDGLVWLHPDTGLIGQGVAARLKLPRGLAADVAWVHAALSSVSSAEDVRLPGAGPVVLGALPFDRTAPAELVVPAQIVGRASDGTMWVTTIGEGSAPEPRFTKAPRAEPGPDGFVLKSVLSHDDWCGRVAHAVADIERGDLEKVVLARAVDVEANRPIVIDDVLLRLAALYPSCAIYRMGSFLGASPELLLSRRGRRVASHPLAGTYVHSADAESDRKFSSSLLTSAKDRHEHQVVVDAVVEGLGPSCETLHVPSEPSIVSLRNVVHLGTKIEGQLHDHSMDALSLAARLHPTPAVCGTPRDAAARWLMEHESLQRGLYAGTVGWMDARGDGDWYVSLRCAEVDGARARMFAGVGVVAGSDPAAELTETQLKFQAMLAAIVRP